MSKPHRTIFWAKLALGFAPPSLREKRGAWDSSAEAKSAAFSSTRTWLTPFLLRSVAKRLAKQLYTALAGELIEEFLQLLLTLMRVALIVDPRLHKDVEGFEGRFQFLSDDGAVAVVAEFFGRCMHVYEGEINDPNITVRFTDSRALMRYLLEPQQDILMSMLQHKVTPEGNLNYLYRFGYLARRLQDLYLPK